MKLSIVKRIRTEDFEQKDQALVEKLSYPINQFIEQISEGFNKNLSVEDNLPFEIKTIPLTVNNGDPITTASFKSSLSGVRGAMVVAAINNENDTVLTGAPFIQFVFSKTQGIVTITKVYGLPNDISFNLTLFLIN